MFIYHFIFFHFITSANKNERCYLLKLVFYHLISSNIFNGISFS